MHVSSETLDDALREVYATLLERREVVIATRGEFREIVGVLVEISNPRARLSRTETRGKLFSSIAELLWYLKGENTLDFILRYIPAYISESDDEMTIHGAYGPRLFNTRGQDQISNVHALLCAQPTSRRAVVQLFDAGDLSRRYCNVPCTISLQFLLREGQLHMLTTMRSNDAYIGFPHDVFCFAMLQEIMARSLNCEIGIYKHFVGSMHLYEANCGHAQQYLEEGIQQRKAMPPMPVGDPWPFVRRMLEAECAIRQGQLIEADSWAGDPYWADLIRLLQIFAADGDNEQIKTLKRAMAFRGYGAYIEGRRTKQPPASSIVGQR